MGDTRNRKMNPNHPLNKEMKRAVGNATLITVLNLRQLFAEFGDCDEVTWTNHKVRVMWAGKGFALELLFEKEFTMQLVCFKSVEGWEDNNKIAKELMTEVAKLLDLKAL